MFSSFKNYLRVLRNENKILKYKQSKNGNMDFIASELIRNTHSIEKGLSIHNPRLGFGHKKQQEMMSLIEELSVSENDYHVEACSMAISALNSYYTFHSDKDYNDEFMPVIEEFLKKHVSSDHAGGTLVFDKSELNFDIDTIESFFKTRHSIRDFSNTPVSDDALIKALRLAQCAPSACNRQGVRAYVLSNDMSKEYSKTLAGIGGFADDANRFVLITGKTTAYRTDEINQYIVSASIYAAYLTMSLHLYGLGGCVIQRPVIWNNGWEKWKREFGIEEDEQLVIMLAVGNLKEKITVPLSHRLTNSKMIQFLK